MSKAELAPYPDPDFQIGTNFSGCVDEEVNFSPNGRKPTYHEIYLADRQDYPEDNKESKVVYTQAGKLCLPA